MNKNKIQFVPTVIIFIVLFLSNPIFGQDSTSLEVIKLENTISFSTDRQGNIFLINTQQDVLKKGDGEHIYSSKKRKEITHIEAWNSLKLFLFNKEYQEFTLLDRYLTLISTTVFNPNELGFVSYATLALDGNIWAIDITDFSLKKIDIRNNKTIVTTNLNLVLDQTENEVLFIKESGNFLYVCTKNSGILVFDNLGTFKKKLPFNNVSFLGFRNNELYFVNKNTLTFFNLLSLEIKKELLPFSGSKALIIKDKLYLVE